MTDHADPAGDAGPLPVPVPLDLPLTSILLPPRRKVVRNERELAAALESAEPGDDILLRGGVYRRQSNWITRSGRPDAPIVLRSAPGDWAVLDGAGARADRAVLELSGDGDPGAGGRYWSIEQLEITDSSTPRGTARRPPINLYGRGSSLRHLVVHDTSHVGNWRQTGPNQCHGLLIFSCGADTNLEHSMYVTGDGEGGPKRITQCVMLNAAAYNLHAFHDRFPVRDLVVEECVATGAGVLRGTDVSRENLFFAVEAGSPERLDGITLERTYQWTAANRTDGVSFGEYGEQEGHGSLALVDNVWQLAEPLDTTRFSAVQGRGGSIAVWPEVVPDGVHHLADPVEEGRGIVIVFNARARAPFVSVDLGRLGIRLGEPYGIWDAADWGPEPLVSGLSIGAASVPTDGSVRAPVGLEPPPTTLPDFGVFIVRRMRRWTA